ncbi:MAG: hypothetical protein GVX96_06085 [Bacteroidetes bacterium]|jgi:hypothetical protein|nr:hypothetical protein [Bacteroidota bacterium]
MISFIVKTNRPLLKDILLFVNFFAATAVAADFDDAFAIVRKETTALKNIYRKYGFLNLSINLNLNLLEQPLRYSPG